RHDLRRHRRIRLCGSRKPRLPPRPPRHLPAPPGPRPPATHLSSYEPGHAVDGRERGGVEGYFGVTTNSPPRLKDVFPDLRWELESSLLEVGEERLIPQVAELPIIGRCSCKQSDCATFYTSEKPPSGWPPPRRSIMLPCVMGYLILDVVGEQIVCVEALDRRQIKKRLDALMPLTD